MGTRSIVSIMDDNQELVRIYRQFDGDPEGMGVDLARLCTDRITNGLCGAGTVNGMRDLAARIVVGLKSCLTSGKVYLDTPSGPIGDWIEYVYIVRGAEGSYPTIECCTHAPDEPAWPFNMQTTSGHVFTGNSAEWLAKYEEPAAKPAPKPKGNPTPNREGLCDATGPRLLA
jgi:hypothetical protein